MNWENFLTLLIFGAIIAAIFLTAALGANLWRRILRFCGGRRSLAIGLVVFLVAVVIPASWLAAKDRIRTSGILTPNTGRSEWEQIATINPGEVWEVAAVDGKPAKILVRYHGGEKVILTSALCSSYDGGGRSLSVKSGTSRDFVVRKR